MLIEMYERSLPPLVERGYKKEVAGGRSPSARDCLEGDDELVARGGGGL